MIEEIRSAAMHHAVQTTWHELHNVTTVLSISDSGHWIKQSFIQRMHWVGLRATHSLAEKSAQLTKLFGVMPDTDGVGEPIQPMVYQKRWGGDPLKLLKHLWKATEGEVAELSGHWTPRWGAPPTHGPLFEQQFSRDDKQWAAKGKGKAKSADGDLRSCHFIQARGCP